MPDASRFRLSEETFRLSYEYWKSLAGPKIDDLMSSRDDAMSQIDSPDANVRLAALSICYHHWRCGDDPSFRAKCLAATEHEADDHARVQAISNLGACYQNTQEKVVLRALVKIVSDTNIPLTVRDAAYRSVRKIEYGWSPEFAVELLNDDYRLEIDDDLIRRYS